TVWLVYVGFLLGAGFGLRRLGLALAPRRKGRAKKRGLWKKFLGSALVVLLFLLVAQVSPAKAALTVDILDLPSYTSTDTFYISYTALDIEGDAVVANFLVKKDGGTFRSLVNGSASGATNKVLVTGQDFYDGQGKYIFRVEVTGGADTSADETNTTFDHSGPSGVQEYRKERLTDSSYRLFWKNPGDSDFNRVFIYRSDKPEFTADGSTKVGEVGGAPDQQMSWDNFGLESGKTYFYALRAVDHAGNGSGIVADQEAQVTAGAVLAAAATTTTTAGAVAGGVEKVKVLPKEEPSEGEILGEEASPSPTAVETPVAEAPGGLLEQLSGNRLLALAVILIVVIGAWVFWPRRPRE
ncbi:MAG: fibronectin type III domain-containing protein, partial [Patescibacteria group bacterium]